MYRRLVHLSALCALTLAVFLWTGQAVFARDGHGAGHGTAGWHGNTGWHGGWNGGWHGHGWDHHDEHFHYGWPGFGLGLGLGYGLRGWGWGGPGYYGNYDYWPYTEGYTYGYPSYDEYNGYPDVMTQAPPLTEGYTSFYLPATSETELGDRAELDVRVPDNAEVWVEGAKMSTPGTDRRFESPPLEPDRTYTYDVRAHWVADGRTIDREQSVNIHAGDRVSVVFPNTVDRPSRVTAPPAPRLAPPALPRPMPNP